MTLSAIVTRDRHFGLRQSRVLQGRGLRALTNRSVVGSCRSHRIDQNHGFGGSGGSREARDIETMTLSAIITQDRRFWLHWSRVLRGCGFRAFRRSYESRRGHPGLATRSVG